MHLGENLGLGPMEIILHLGAHRCASTTFQSYMWTNREILANAGLTSWTPRRTGDGLMRGMMRHPALITLEDERQAIRSVGRIRIELDRLRRAGQRTLIISEENLLGSMKNNLRDARLYPLLRERLMRFRPAFEGYDLTVGFGIRSYEDYWASCLAHLMGQGHARPNTDTLDWLTTQPRRWRSLVRDMAAAFPRADIVVWPFERLGGHPDVVLQQLIGRFSPAPGSDGAWRNRGKTLVELNHLVTQRGEAPLDDRLLDTSARWMPFDEDQRSVLRAEYRRDLAWFKSGAECLARYADGRDQLPEHSVRSVRPDLFKTTRVHLMHAISPDRAQDATVAATIGAPIGGNDDGIKEGLGRSG